MGAKTPEGHEQAPNGGSKNDFNSAANPPLPANSASAAHLFGQTAEKGDDDDDDGDDDDDTTRGSGLKPASEKKKNKKRKKSKKSKTKTASTVQTSPPEIPVAQLFPNGCPPGELVPYENTARTTSEESRYNSRLWDDDFLINYREAAEVHRQVRQYAQEHLIKPGASMLSIAEGIEKGVRDLTGHQGLDPGDGIKASMGFPTGLCLNNVAAHWTPNPGGKEVLLKESDVLSVDFGVQVNGRIVDSAFTVAFDSVYDNLLAAPKEATNTGIAHAGVDARLNDISEAIQEVMESYEVEIEGKTKRVKAVRNITAHDIKHYHIHGGKQIPFVKSSKDLGKMEEGEMFAIETFGSTGNGWLHDDVGIYGYGRSSSETRPARVPGRARDLLKTIDDHFGTIVFCRRYLERLGFGVKDYLYPMKHLVEAGIVESYAPLVDTKGTYVAQFEHTILIHEGGKEVVSRGADY